MGRAQSLRKVFLVTALVVEFLGQAGFRLSSGKHKVYIDPYLSDSVRVLDAADLERQVPVPMAPDSVTDAETVLITHAHIDHCDPHTIPALAKASPHARFVGPAPVISQLREWGLAGQRVLLAQETWQPLLPGVEFRAVPAAHPAIERDARGQLACVGYMLRNTTGRLAYFAGDTGVVDEIVDSLMQFAPVEYAFLPVNEQNYFRARRGIIGNMTVREAFMLAQEIGANKLFPYHWDMFSANGAYPEEVTLIRDKMSPSCEILSTPLELFQGAQC